MSFKFRSDLIQSAKNFAAKRPKEVKWTVIGGASGVPVGLAIGGVGVVALGGGVGIPAAALCSVVGAAIGNRFGVGKDRPLPKDEKQETN